MRYFISAALYLFACFQLSAAIATWGFDSGTTWSDPYTANTHDPNLGAQLHLGLNGSTPSIESGQGNPGNALQILGTPAQVNGTTLQFTLVAVNANAQVSGLSLDFLRLWPTGSPTSISWNYSVSGSGGSGSLGSTALPDSEFYQTASLTPGTPISLSPSQNTLTLTGTLAGGGAEAGGDIWFDNFSFNGTVTPVPEPVHYAMGLFGLIFAGGSYARHLYRRMRAR